MPRKILLFLIVVLASSGIVTPSVAAQSDQIPTPNTEGLEPAVAALLDSTYANLAEVSDPDANLDAFARAAKWGEAGEVFHAHGALDSAIACYRRALELAPDDARWPYLIAYILEGRGESAEALSLLEGALRLDPNPFTTFRMGKIYLADGRIEEALPALEPLRAVEGLQAAVLAELGKAALLTGDYAAAAANFGEALELQPQALSLHFPLSQAYRGLGDQSSAQEHADLGGTGKVRVFDPFLQEVGERSVSSETYVTMGAQALKAGRTEIATAAYRKAVELNPDNQRAWMNLGVLAMEADNSSDAEVAFRRALELEPEYGYAHFNLAKLLSQEDRPEEALEHYRAAVTSNPRNIEFGMAYADQLMRAEEWQAAAAQYQTVATESPDSVRPLYLRSLALVAVGNLSEAAVSVREAWQINPQNPSVASAFVRLTSTVDSAEDVRSEALELAARLHREQRSVETGEQLAMALAANGRFEEAVAMQQSLIGVLEGGNVPGGLLSFARQSLTRYQKGTLAAAPWPPASGLETP